MCYLLAVCHEPDAPLVDAAQGYRTGMGLFQLAIEVRLAPVRSLLLLPSRHPSPLPCAQCLRVTPARR